MRSFRRSYSVKTFSFSLKKHAKSDGGIGLTALIGPIGKPMGTG